MRTIFLIAAAGLTGLVAAPAPAAAQYYGWGFYRPYAVPYYRPYYPVPYGYYPGPYYAPPPVYEPPPPRGFRYHAVRRIQHRIVAQRRRVVHQPLVNPLLGPLPGASPPRQR